MKSKYRIIVIIYLVFIVLKTNAQNTTINNVAIGLDYPANGVAIKSNFPAYTGGWSKGFFVTDQTGSQPFITFASTGISSNGISSVTSSFIGKDLNNRYMTFLTNGYVGIGTSTPAVNLHVQNTNAATSMYIGNNAVGKTYAIFKTSADSNGYFEISSIKAQGSVWGNLILNPSNGSVGIGTTAPSQKLEVNGNIKATSFIKTGGTASQFLKADGSVDSNGYNPLITAGTTTQYWRGDKTWQPLDKTAVGLVNVDNTNDVNKPVSTATQTALNLKANLASPTFTGTVSGITKAMVGLGNVDNTTDAAKPISTATQTALNTKQATLVSGTSIKTINGTSLLGSGDIKISSGGSIAPLEFDAFNSSVWNNGGSNLDSNTSFGMYSFVANSTGLNNSTYGWSSFSNNTSGSFNSAFGSLALSSSIGGESNSAFGYSSLSSITNSASQNSAFGNNALKNVYNGSLNIGIGSNSGVFLSDNTTELGISNASIFIGADTKALNQGSLNQIVIGHAAIGAGSNTATLGNTSITKTILRGEVQGGSFKKEGGTSSQYLMADGSVSTGASGEPVITAGTTSQYWRGDKTWQTLDKSVVGLANVDNTNDANKPISTATQTALNTKQATLVSGTSIKTINGNSLLGSGDITISNGGSFVDLTTNQTIAGTKNFSSNVNTTSINGLKIGGDYTSGASGCTVVGLDALANNKIPSFGVTAIGFNALNANNIAPRNTGVGSSVLANNINGFNNSALGMEAGASYSFATPTTLLKLTNASNCVFVGYQSRPLNNNTNNEIVIGTNAVGAGSNTATLGNTDVTKTILRGEVLGGSFKKDGGTSSQYLMADGSVRTGASGEPVITAGTTSQYWRGDKTWQILDKASVGLGNIDNTTDANKPISTATQLALDGKQNTLTNPITGTGTINYISKFTSSGKLSDSAIYDNGTNVGIGTTSPSDKLDINGNIKLSASDSRIKAGDISGRGIYSNSDISSYFIAYGSSNSSEPHTIEITSGSGTSNGKIAFNTATTERMRITSGGNIGIGTTSPSEKLEVSGNVKATSFIKTGGTSSQYLMADGSVSTSSNAITGTTNYISKFTASGTLSDSSMYDNGGNVGIGTTAPDAKLAVKGQIHAQEVKVDLQGAMVPDYVFAKEYKLKSLSEVDAYIKANSHLPEVPSAQEIEKNGLQLGEMNMVLLKKIEELTLHAIEQQNQIERLKTENETYKTFAERLATIEKELKK